MKRLLFGPQDSVRDWLSWREIHPILLRSAGLVGLAVAVVAIVSDQSFVSEPQAQPQIVVASVRPEPAGPAVVEPLLEAPNSAEDFPAQDALAADREPAPLGPPVGAQGGAALAPDSGPHVRASEAETASAGTNGLATAPETAAATVAADPGAAAQQTLALVLPSEDRFAVETPEPPRKAALWPEAASQCPRDWLAAEGSDDATGPSPECTTAAPVIGEAVSAPPAAPALHEAVAERATQIAGLQFAPRLPQARPKSPPTKAKARSRRGRLGPPPNCGRKYARWRYVNKVPTWYCK